MGWVADVEPNTTISSSQYGNAIRDRVVHQFANVAERNAQAIPVDGMFCYTAAERTVWCYVAAGGWGWRIWSEPWRDLSWNPALGGPRFYYGPNGNEYYGEYQAGHVLYRRWGLEHADYALEANTGYAQNFSGGPFAVNWQFGHGISSLPGLWTLGHGMVWDSLTGLQVGGLAAQSAGTPYFTMTAANGLVVQVGGQASQSIFSLNGNSSVKATWRVIYVAAIPLDAYQDDDVRRIMAAAERADDGA